MALTDTSVEAESAADVIGEAARSGAKPSKSGSIRLRDALAEASDLLNQARRDGAFRASLPHVLGLVRLHPGSMDLQVTAARLLSENHDRASLMAWEGVCRRFPEAPEPFRVLLRLTLREKGREAAESLFEKRFATTTADEDELALLSVAFALEELGRRGEAESAFAEVVRRFPRSRPAWRRLIFLREARGDVNAALRTATDALRIQRDARITQVRSRLAREARLLNGILDIELADGVPLSVRVLAGILADVLKRRLSSKFPIRNHLGGVIMVTGSLGSGGAERQLVATVGALRQAVNSGAIVGRYAVVGPVSVACRSLSSKQGNDFFLETLARYGTPVTDYSRLAPFGGAERLSVVRPWRRLINFLPARTKEGVTRLAEFLRYEAPDVVQIWQDGMVLAAGLAALMADVPRIILSVRTLPPIDRVNRWRPELEPVYRGLLSASGVTMTANSAQVAKRYEDWLEMRRGSVVVIKNGVERLGEQPGPDDEQTWDEFDARTHGAQFTVGGVMRLDANKRPLEWLTIAEKLHRRRPNSRFILVGDGELREEVQEYARRLGLAGRVLVTGRSASVGFWLTRMDALMLLSRYEGMPNVLIEAQIAGVPVVATPAGGSAETLIHGETGFLLSSAEAPDPDEAVSRLAQIMDMSPGAKALMSAHARSWAERSFSVAAMLRQSVELFMTSPAI